MELSADQLERVVREVLRRLGAAGDSSAAATPATLPSADKQDLETLPVNLPVVSVAQLERSLTGIKQVVVPAGAIVTPAALDLLRQKKVTLVRGAAKTPTTTEHGRLCVGVVNTTFKSAALFYDLQSQGIELEELAHNGLSSVISELCQRLARGESLGLLLTSQVAAAVCLANRHARVRAAEARCATSAREATRTLGINLLVVNPLGKSPFELKCMIGIHLAGGGRAPADWPEPN